MSDSEEFARPATTILNAKERAEMAHEIWLNEERKRRAKSRVASVKRPHFKEGVGLV